MDTACVANRITKNIASNWESNIGSTRVLYMNANSTMQYNLNVTDLENDSTSIKLVSPADSMQTWGASLLYQNANYKPGYSLVQPLGAGSTVSITDTFLNMASQNPGVYLLTVQIEDYDTTMAFPNSNSKSLNDFVVVVMPNVPTELEEDNKFPLKFTPNPICDYLRLSGIQKNDEIVVFNQWGRPIYTEKCSSENHIIMSLNLLSNGVYFLKLIRNEKVYRTKFLKN